MDIVGGLSATTLGLHGTHPLRQVPLTDHTDPTDSKGPDQGRNVVLQRVLVRPYRPRHGANQMVKMFLNSVGDRSGF